MIRGKKIDKVYLRTGECLDVRYDSERGTFLVSMDWDLIEKNTKAELVKAIREKEDSYSRVEYFGAIDMDFGLTFSREKDALYFSAERLIIAKDKKGMWYKCHLRNENVRNMDDRDDIYLSPSGKCAEIAKGSRMEWIKDIPYIGNHTKMIYYSSEKWRACCKLMEIIGSAKIKLEELIRDDVAFNEMVLAFNKTLALPGGS